MYPFEVKTIKDYRSTLDEENAFLEEQQIEFRHIDTTFDQDDKDICIRTWRFISDNHAVLFKLRFG